MRYCCRPIGGGAAGRCCGLCRAVLRAARNGAESYTRHSCGSRRAVLWAAWGGAVDCNAEILHGKNTIKKRALQGFAPFFMPQSRRKGRESLDTTTKQPLADRQVFSQIAPPIKSYNILYHPINSAQIAHRRGQASRQKPHTVRMKTTQRQNEYPANAGRRRRKRHAITPWRPGEYGINAKPRRHSGTRAAKQRSGHRETKKEQQRRGARTTINRRKNNRGAEQERQQGESNPPTLGRVH